MSYFDHSVLLATPPVKRAAYSDRTAWVMGELSRLVYDRLPNEEELQALADRLVAAVREKKGTSEVLSIAAEVASSSNETRASLTDEVLKAQQFELVTNYSISGTEAMLVKIPPKPEFGFSGMLVLVFRGTEITSITDIRSDVRVNLVDAPGGGRVHRGFYEAYQKVEDWLKKDLAKAGELPVYVTGHSLGGALALVATRYLCCDSVGATYTFGGPRVGDDAFFEGIKTPVYRVVNAADLVARVPFGAGLTCMLSLIRCVPFNGTKWISELLRRRIGEYTHYGCLCLLAAKKDTKGVYQMYFSPTIFKIAQVAFPGLVIKSFTHSLTDHAMLGYCEKLASYALSRQ